MHYDWDPKRFISPETGTPAAYAGWLERQLGEPNVVLFATEVNGDVVGYVYAALEGPNYAALRGPAGVVHDLFVQTEYRKAGLGEALLRAAVQQLERMGAPQIVLSTAHENDAAQRLFARIGFRPSMVEMTLSIGGA